MSSVNTSPSSSVSERVRNLLLDDDTEIVGPAGPNVCAYHEPMTRRVERVLTGQQFLAEGMDENADRIRRGFAAVHRRFDDLHCARRAAEIAANTATLRLMQRTFAIAVTVLIAVFGGTWYYVSRIEEAGGTGRREAVPGHADEDMRGGVKIRNPKIEIRNKSKIRNPQ